MLPVEHLSPFVIFLHILDPPVLGYNKAIPVGPIGVLHLHIPVFICIPLLEADEFVEIGEHIDEHTALVLAPEEVLDCELDAVLGFEDVDHLTDDVLEVEVEIALHIGQSLALLLVEVLQLVASDDAVAVEIHYLEPVLDALLGGLVLDAHDEPDEVSEAHLLLVLEFLDGLREDALEGLPGEGVAGVLREFFPAELEVVVVVQLPEFDVDHVEIFVAEEFSVLVDFRLILDVEQALQHARFLELPNSTQKYLKVIL